MPRITGDREAYFWNTQGGAELDLLVFINGQRYGFEFKYADAPGITKSLQVAHEDLNLRRVFVVHPGTKSYPLNDWAETVSLRDLRTRLSLLDKPQRGFQKATSTSKVRRPSSRRSP